MSGVESFTDYGSSVQTNTTQTHHLTMYPAANGALVFGAGTVQWAWGLDTTNAWNNNGPQSGSSPDPVMQQATVNLFADMGAQATTLMAGLTAASASTDTTAPSTTITSPSAGAAIVDGARVTVSGTASDAGAVAGVEVSTDGGTSWHPATGTTSWTYSWIAHGAPGTTIKARAVDDSGNLESTPPSVAVDVACPCSLFGPNVTPATLDQGDTNPVELGVKFKADLDGSITGVRFYKAVGNTGTHIGNLWTTSGTLLARGTFASESASGWQEMTFPTPVDVSAGTTYIASYYAPRGHYSATTSYFFQPGPTGGNSLDSPPLHAISSNRGGANGVYSYAGATTFPTATFNGEDYAVDPVFIPKLPPGPVGAVTATAGPGSATVSFSAPSTGGPPTRYVVTPFIGSTAQTPVTVQGSPPAIPVKVSGLDAGTSYTFKVQAANGSGSGPLSAASNAVTPTQPTAPGAPTDLVPSGGNQQATVRWTAPADGGATITRYTVTPYLGGVAQAATVVNGSPAPTSAVVTGLTNGSSYTFKVSATNSVGTGPDSTMSIAVSPSAAPRFVQRVSGRQPAGPTLVLTPASNLTTGNRIVVMAGVWSAAAGTIARVTDAAGNVYTNVTSVKASDDTELSVWSAPVTAGGGTRPAITITATGSADIGGAALEYAGLSTASGAAAIDALKTATGTSIGTGFVTSGPTAPLAGDNGLALGFYADSGFGRTLVADPTYTERVNVSPTSDMEFVAEDALPLRGDTPAARVTTGGGTPWTMATVVFKTGTQSPPSLSVSPASLAFNGPQGGASPAAKTIAVSNGGGGTLDWTASESASWLSISPSSGTNNGTITVTPSTSGLAAGTYTTDVTVSAGGVAGSPKTVPVTLTVDPVAPPALSVSPASLAFGGTQGGAEPGRQDDRRQQQRRRQHGLDRVGERGLAQPLAVQRDERRDDHGHAVDHRARRRHLHDRRHRGVGRRDRLAEDDPGHLHGRPTGPGGAGRDPGDARLHRHAGRREPGRQDGRGQQHRQRQPRRDRERRRRVAHGDPRERLGPGDADGHAVDHRPGGGQLHGDRDRHGDHVRGDRLAQDDRRHAERRRAVFEPRRRVGIRRDRGDDDGRRVGPRQHGDGERRNAGPRGPVRRRAQLRRRQRLGHRARREHAGPHHGHDGRGLGAPDRRGLALAHRPVQGAARQPDLLAVRG